MAVLTGLVWRDLAMIIMGDKVLVVRGDISVSQRSCFLSLSVSSDLTSGWCWCSPTGRGRLCWSCATSSVPVPVLKLDPRALSSGPLGASSPSLEPQEAATSGHHTPLSSPRSWAGLSWATQETETLRPDLSSPLTTVRQRSPAHTEISWAWLGC